MNWMTGCNSPEDTAVLLYVVFYHEDKKSIWDEKILVGFYDSEECVYKHDSLNSDYWHEIENELIKVIAWTLIPCKEYEVREIVKREMNNQ